MQLTHCRTSGRVRAQVLLSLRPTRRVARVEQHDFFFQGRSLSCFPVLEIFHGDLIVGLGRAARRHVDASRCAHQPRQRDFIDRLSFFKKVDWRVDVRTAVLWRLKAIGGIVVAALRDSCRSLP